MSMRDVFYYGAKPNVHPKEQYAENLIDARRKAVTREFWIVNEYCDYRNFDWDFDFEFLPDEDVWAEDHNNVWPSQHQKDSGTWLCPKEHSDVIIYRNDVDPLRRKNEKNDNWVQLDLIDPGKFDFSWHPDPSDPPYIYKWGCKYYPTEVKHVLEYHVEGATASKYVDTIAELLPNSDNWVMYQDVDTEKFDLSWRPNPLDPPYIYVWGNKHFEGKTSPTIEYHVPGATDRKYLTLLAPLKSSTSDFEFFEDIDESQFDFTWVPNPTSPPYIYVWGNQWHPAEEKISIQYAVPGATEYKFMIDRTVRKPKLENWYIPEHIDTTEFDFSWEPNPHSPPYIYEFGTQWQKTGGPQYIVPGATEKKYIDVQKAKRLDSMENWEVPDHIDGTEFDFSWHPDDTSPPFIYVFPTRWETDNGPIYTVPGAASIKYVTDQISVKKKDWSKWVYDSDLIDVDSFDFTWYPPIDDPLLIYQFGTQWQKTGGPRYVPDNATSSTPIKYVDTPDLQSVRKSNKADPKWKIHYPIKDFDFSWHPDSTEDPYIYVFGNNLYRAEECPTVEYRVENATQFKYVDTLTATLDVTMEHWEILHDIDMSRFDFSWMPNPNDPPYIYVFGNQWYSGEDMPTVKYTVPGATEHKYISFMTATLKPNMDHWEILHDIDMSKFDFSWVPNPHDPPYKYVFGNQWHSGEDMATVIYVADGATEYKFVSKLKAKLNESLANWEIDDGVDTSSFDFSWIPHPAAPAYIYQFGTLLDNNDGPKYSVPDNTGEVVYLPRIEIQDKEIVVKRYYIETTLSDLVDKHPNEIFWAMRRDIDYNGFDFDWRPGTVEVAWELDYVHVFGSSESDITQTYFVSGKHYLEGKTNYKYVNDVQLSEKALAELFAKPDVFFVDRGNPDSVNRLQLLKEKFGSQIQKTRYLNSWVDTISRCANRASSKLFWVLDSELDYTDFNFEYFPNPWQMTMVHVFGTQWSQWGTTFMVNRETFQQDTKHIKIIEHLSNINFVKHIRAKADKSTYDVVLIDHGNKELSEVASLLKRKIPNRKVEVVSYTDSYLTTLKNIVADQPTKKDHYLWICSSVCDYQDFDFSYVVDPFAKDQLHVFPSGTQKFGDTFFLDVNKAREVIDELELLEQFNKVNYNATIRASRLPEPVIVSSDDTHINSITKITDFPYATIVTADNLGIEVEANEPMNLWTSDTKNIIITSTGATRIIVPSEAASIVKKELYDYPYIKRTPKLSKSSPMDIIFLSNGEKGADENWEHLLSVTAGLSNRVVRVDGVNGRVAAYHAAAEASNTPWFFTVFAKLKVNEKFDWGWQPDRMQCSKHYIFYAKNPVNGLIYGHQAMIAYNKKLTLANDGKGLDFTLDDEHEVVPHISGTAHYNTDMFSTWRTAFREVLKLKADENDMSIYRLDAWLHKAEGEFGEYSIKGAVDASNYYDEVNGDFEKLKLSYEWDWLRKKFDEM